MKKTEEQQKEKSVVELDSIIKSIKRRLKKHPEENLRPQVYHFSDQQVKELKRGIRELEEYIQYQFDEEENGKEEL